MVRCQPNFIVLSTPPRVIAEYIFIGCSSSSSSSKVGCGTGGATDAMDDCAEELIGLYMNPVDSGAVGVYTGLSQ